LSGFLQELFLTVTNVSSQAAVKIIVILF